MDAHEIDHIENELSRWRKCGERLFPFVRYFGLCGANVEAVEAVVEMSRLLGHKTEEKSVSPDQVKMSVEIARSATIKEISDYIRSSSEIRSAYGNGGTESLADYVAKLATES